MKVIKGCLGMIVLLVLGLIAIGYLVGKNASTSGSSIPAIAPAAPPISVPNTTPDYTVEIKDTSDLTNVQITFNKLPATEIEAAKTVRQEIDKAIEKDGTKGILAMAFDMGDNALPDEKYGGPLTYSPKDKSVMTMSQRDGLKTQTQQRNAYFVKTEEEKTYEGITPARKWLTLSVVFPNAPSSDQFNAAAKNEINKLKSRHLDVTVYGFAGDSGNSMTWEQVKSPSGHYMDAEYTAADEAIKLR